MSSSVHAMFILALLSCVLDSSAMPKQDAKSEEGCLVDGVKHNVGDTWSGPVGVCTTLKCGPGGSIFGLSCGTFAVSPESQCSISDYDYTVQYPYCCPNVSCPDDKTTTSTIHVE